MTDDCPPAARQDLDDLHRPAGVVAAGCDRQCAWAWGRRSPVEKEVRGGGHRNRHDEERCEPHGEAVGRPQATAAAYVRSPDDVAPVADGRLGRDETFEPRGEIGVQVECAHTGTSDKAERRDVCAACSVADTVPTLTSSVAAISR